MTWRNRRLCLSTGARTVRALRAAVDALPAAVDLVEVRADRLDPLELGSDAWLRLPGDTAREWLLTWRSSREGGRDARPHGLYARALDAGFRWVDVEAAALDAGDAEAAAVPPDRRWVSRHLAAPPASADAVEAAYEQTAVHPGVLHKLVVTADRFTVNAWVLDTGRRARARGPASVFAQGWVGQVSRLAGHAEGNAVTFVAGDDPTAPGQPTWREALHRYDLPRVTGAVDLYGVLGNPVRASRSPDMHNHAFRSRGRAALYVPLESEDPEPVLAWVRSDRLRGVSVTAPFKQRAARFVDGLELDAARLDAVNTVWKENGELVGANTDIEAARSLIPEITAPGSPVAVIGAGGAAAAVAAAAGDLEHPVTVFNRTEAAGRGLAERLGLGWGGPPEVLDPGAFGLVANATPLGAAVPVPEALLRRRWPGTPVLDLAYGAAASGWERLAAGCAFRGGLTFLARQAAGQVRRWTGDALDPALFEEGLA